MSKRLWNDRRGAAAWLMGAAIIPVIGMVGLGTEIGSWNVARRHAQNTADATAIAGATALVVGDSNGAVTAGQAFATSNGFTTPSNCSTATTGRTVCITTPGGAGVGTTVTAVVRHYQTPILTQWFVPAGRVKIEARATAQIQQKPGFCMLGLQSLDISGNFSFSGGCGLASNGTFAPPPAGQNPFLGNPNIWSVSAAGACTGNANKCNLSGEVKSYSYNTGTPVSTPALDRLMTSGVVTTDPGITTAVTSPNPSTSWQGKYTVPAAGATLAPGLYMFHQLVVNGPLHSTAAGVNIIIGSGGFSGSGNMDITAGNGGGLSDMNGVLIYDLEGKGASKTPDIKFTGQYTSNFNGAVYFPYAHLTFRGGSGLTGCMIVVAKILDFGGDSSIDMSGCSDSILRNDVVQTNVVMLTN